MKKELTEKSPALTESLIKSISECLDFKFTYSYKNNKHLLMSKEINEYNCSIHALEDNSAFYFSVRSFNVANQKKILTILDEQHPLDMTLYRNTLMTLSNLYTSLSFAVKPLKTDKTDNLTWMSYCKTKRSTGIKCWTNFDEMHYQVSLYPWKKNILHLTVSQKIKMILINHKGTYKYIPTLETSLPLNHVKRTEICISLEKEIQGIYVLNQNGEYQIEPLESIVNLINRSIRNYIYTSMIKKNKLDIPRHVFIKIELDKYLQYIALNEMVEI